VYSSPPHCHYCRKVTYTLLEDAVTRVIWEWRNHRSIHEVYRCPRPQQFGYHLTNVLNKLHKRRKRQYGDDYARRIEQIAWLFILQAADADPKPKRRVRSNVEAVVPGVPEVTAESTRLELDVQRTERDNRSSGTSRLATARRALIALYEKIRRMM